MVESKAEGGSVRILKRVKVVQNNELGDQKSKWTREMKE